MFFEITNSDQHISVHLTGIVSVKEATSIRQALFPLMQKGFLSLSINLGSVVDIDSSGLGLLLAAQKIATEFNSSLTFIDVNEQLQVRLNLAGINLYSDS